MKENREKEEEKEKVVKKRRGRKSTENGCRKGLFQFSYYSSKRTTLMDMLNFIPLEEKEKKISNKLRRNKIF